MQIPRATEAANQIMARFRMCGVFVDEAMHRMYYLAMLPYDDDHVEKVVGEMLAAHRVPVTDAELEVMIRPPAPEKPLFTGPRTDPAKGRQIMRRAWIDSWCERHGGTEADFWAEDARLAAQEHRPTLKAQWARTDREIAEKKAKGLSVDESGLTSGAVVHSLREDLTPSELRRKEQAHREAVGRAG